MIYKKNQSLQNISQIADSDSTSDSGSGGPSQGSMTACTGEDKDNPRFWRHRHHNSVDAGAATQKRSFTPEDLIAIHAEADFYLKKFGSGCALEDEDRDRAAGIALGEGHDGSGNPLVNSDGSLWQLPQLDHFPVESEEFDYEEVFFESINFCDYNFGVQMILNII